MKSRSLLLIGTAICTCGGLLIFPRHSVLPLWIVWILGPLCWYLGASAMFIGATGSVYAYLKSRRVPVPAEPESETITVIEFLRFAPFTHAPRGVTREIPPMGGIVI